MAFIFGTGIKYAALISALALSAIPIITNANPPQNSLAIEIEGLRNQKGQILICLTDNPKSFPDCSKDANSVRLAVNASEAENVRVTAPKAGQYAIALVHDENGNGKLDTVIFLPKEGFGFSRNPTITTGPPKFRSASFAVDGPQNLTIKMRYML